MNRLPSLLALAACATAPAALWAEPSPMSIGELPGQKVPEILQTRDRNPFVRREAKDTALVPEVESEESRIREALASFSIRGVIRGESGTKVLLENLTLRLGMPLPPLLEEQTEQLYVGLINDRQVELFFVETEENAEPRKVIIPIDLRPRVRVLRQPLVAPTPSATPAKRSGGTMRTTRPDGTTVTRNSSPP